VTIFQKYIFKKNYYDYFFPVKVITMWLIMSLSLVCELLKLSKKLSTIKFICNHFVNTSVKRIIYYFSFIILVSDLVS